jgi:hypothetical protein
MTRYTVTWEPEAEEQLADLWMAAPDRAAVTAAESAIGAALARNPAGVGSEVAEGLRLFTVPPLRVFYEVSEADRLVRVSVVDRAREGP